MNALRLVPALPTPTPVQHRVQATGKATLAKVKKPTLREPPEFMREEERIAQLEANQKRWDKYLQDCLTAETRMVRCR